MITTGKTVRVKATGGWASYLKGETGVVESYDPDSGMYVVKCDMLLSGRLHFYERELEEL